MTIPALPNPIPLDPTDRSTPSPFPYPGDASHRHKQRLLHASRSMTRPLPPRLSLLLLLAIMVSNRRRPTDERTRDEGGTGCPRPIQPIHCLAHQFTHPSIDRQALALLGTVRASSPRRPAFVAPGLLRSGSGSGSLAGAAGFSSRRPALPRIQFQQPRPSLPGRPWQHPPRQLPAGGARLYVRAAPSSAPTAAAKDSDAAAAAGVTGAGDIGPCPLLEAERLFPTVVEFDLPPPVAGHCLALRLPRWVLVWIWIGAFEERASYIGFERTKGGGGEQRSSVPPMPTTVSATPTPKPSITPTGSRPRRGAATGTGTGRRTSRC